MACSPSLSVVTEEHLCFGCAGSAADYSYATLVQVHSHVPCLMSKKTNTTKVKYNQSQPGIFLDTFEKSERKSFCLIWLMFTKLIFAQWQKQFPFAKWRNKNETNFYKRGKTNIIYSTFCSSELEKSTIYCSTLYVVFSNHFFCSLSARKQTKTPV